MAFVHNISYPKNETIFIPYDLIGLSSYIIKLIQSSK